MPTDPVVEITSSSAFTDAFSANTGTQEGLWRYDSGGSSASSRTGPGSNNRSSFMHTETTSSGGGQGDYDLETWENNGIAVFANIPNGIDRSLALRVCIQGEFGTGEEGLRVQYQTETDGDWILAELISGWSYSSSYEDGDTITNELGVDLTCALDGGWIDFDVSIPDNAIAVRIKPKYLFTNVGNEANWRHDVALRSYQWTYEELSDDADLSSLTLDNVVLVPAFATNTLEYTAEVEFSFMSTLISAVANDTGATIMLDGSGLSLDGMSQTLNFVVGENTFRVVVTAADGTTKTYRIVVTRLDEPASTDADLSNLVLSDIVLVPGFASDHLAYSARVDHTVEETTVTPTLSDSEASFIVQLAGVTDGDNTISLEVGENVISVQVTAEDAVTIKTYTITIVRSSARFELLKRKYFVGLDNTSNRTDGNNVSQDAFGEGTAWRFGKDSISPFTPPTAGRCDFRLWNLDGDYSFGGDSEIQPNMPISLLLDDEVSWLGEVKDVNRFNQRGLGSVHVKALDVFGRLNRTPVTISVQEEIRIDTAIAMVLDAVGGIEYDLEQAQTSLKFWWTNDENALDILKRLLFTEGLGAALYVYKGRIQFKNRQHRILSTRSSSTQALFHDGAVQDSQINAGPGIPVFPYFGEMKIQIPQQNIVNVCNMQVVDLQKSELQEVWKAPASIAITGGVPVVLPINLGQAVIDAATPDISENDYELPPGQQGAPAITLSATSGNKIIMTLTSAVSITVNNLRLRAKLLEETARYTATNKVGVSDSIERFGEKIYNVEGYPYISLAEAESICDSVVLNYADIRPIATIMIIDHNDEMKDYIKDVDIGDRIRIKSENDLSIDNFFHIEMVEHKVKRNGALHECYLTCILLPIEVPTDGTDPIDPGGDTMILGTGQLGTNTLGA